MNKVELSGRAYDILKDEEGYYLFDLEFQKNRFITVGCTGESAIEISQNFTDGMFVTVNGEISIGKDDLFYHISDEDIYIKAKKVINGGTQNYTIQFRSDDVTGKPNQADTCRYACSVS